MNSEKEELETFPWIDPELISRLNLMYPERCADPGMSVEQIWLRTGERMVIRKLNQLYEEQTQKATEGDVNVHVSP